MEYEDRFLAEMLARNVLGPRYKHKADNFLDIAYTKGVVNKCIKKIRSIVDQLECHEQLRHSIHRNLDHLERSLKGKRDSKDYAPTIYALSVIWNLLGGLGQIRYWVPEYTQDEIRYLNQKEFLEGGDMIRDGIELERTAHEEQLQIITTLKQDGKTVVEISKIMNLPEGRIRKMLKELSVAVPK